MLKNKSSQKLLNIYFNKRKRYLFKIMDKVFFFVYSIASIFKKHTEDCIAPRKILLLNSHLIGDVVMAIPAYRAIRKLFPAAEMIFWGNVCGKELLKNQSIFTDFYSSKIPWSMYDYTLRNICQLLKVINTLKKQDIDLAIDFRGDLRNILLLKQIKPKKLIGYDLTGGSYLLDEIVPLYPEKMHIIDRHLNVAEYLNAPIESQIPYLVISKDDNERVITYFKQKILADIVYIHAVSSQPKRIWPMERFSKICDYLNSIGLMPVIIAGPKDDEYINIIISNAKSKVFVLKRSLSEIPAFFSKGKLFIGLDSGLAHISAAVGLSSIVLFGPQQVEVSIPRSNATIEVLRSPDITCRPCSDGICKNDNKCMKDITADDVISKIAEMIK